VRGELFSDAAGPTIGELITSSGISAVLDMGQMRKAEQAGCERIFREKASGAGGQEPMRRS
jgi:hypothetical protein